LLFQVPIEKTAGTVYKRMPIIIFTADK